jgi:hypothetical protein
MRSNSAEKLGKHPETIRRMPRTGRLVGEKIGSKGKAGTPTSSLTTKLPALSRHELKGIAGWGLFPKGIPDQVVREMLQSGFFRKAIVMYELDRAEAIARQILEKAENESCAIDASLIAEAKRILSIRDGFSAEPLPASRRRAVS